MINTNAKLFKEMSYFLYIKALHIIFVVSWFSGLFYFVRLLIYHTEAFGQEEPKRTILHEEYIKNERLLSRIIMNPAMVLTLATGIWMLVLMPSFLEQPWMHIKLAFVVLLLIYHHYCIYLSKKLRNANSNWTSVQLRMWNEVATLFLVAIVFLVVLKNSMNWIWGTVGFFLFGIMIMLLVRLIRKNT